MGVYIVGGFDLLFVETMLVRQNFKRLELAYLILEKFVLIKERLIATQNRPKKKYGNNPK